MGSFWNCWFNLICEIHKYWIYLWKLFHESLAGFCDIWKYLSYIFHIILCFYFHQTYWNSFLEERTRTPHFLFMGYGKFVYIIYIVNFFLYIWFWFGTQQYWSMGLIKICNCYSQCHITPHLSICDIHIYNCEVLNIKVKSMRK